MYEDFFGADVMGYDDVAGVALSRGLPQRGGVRGPATLLRRGGFPVQRQLGSPMSPYPMPPLPMGPSAVAPTARLRSYLGMGTLSWTGAADSGLKQAQNTLQESFRPERLIIVESVVGGASAGIVLLNQVFAGTMPQSPSISTGTPVAMFSANATYSAVDMQIVWRGTQLTVQCSMSASPGAGVTHTIAIGFYGQWIR